MSANYTLTVANPSVSGSTTNIVYTGTSNMLNLTITNNFGYDMTIGDNPGQYLEVLISGGILDTKAAGNVTAASPWKIASYDPPNGTPPFFTFNLSPPPGGVPIPNGGSIVVELQNIDPTATGTATVITQYKFDATPSDDLNASASLGSLAPPTNQPPLVGDNDALRLTIYVNGGALSNPIMVSQNASNPADNSIHLNFLFQNASYQAAALGNSSGVLVPSWNSNTPPAFRIYFPYFNTWDSAPAPMDLTDSYPAGNSQY